MLKIVITIIVIICIGLYVCYKYNPNFNKYIRTEYNYLYHKLQTRNRKEYYNFNTNVKKHVIIAHYSEDLKWVDNLKFPYTIISRKNMPRETAPNKGNEASAYLEYIINNYNNKDNLEDIYIFVHGHRSDWHHKTKMDEKLNKLKFDKNYYNINETLMQKIPNDEHDNINKMLKELYPIFSDLDITKIKYRKCAQFYVTKKLIHTHDIDFYKSLLNWIYTTSFKSYWSGRLFEYLWHFIFTSQYHDIT